MKKMEKQIIQKYLFYTTKRLYALLVFLVSSAYGMEKNPFDYIDYIESELDLVTNQSSKKEEDKQNIFNISVYQELNSEATFNNFVKKEGFDNFDDSDSFCNLSESAQSSEGFSSLVASRDKSSEKNVSHLEEKQDQNILHNAFFLLDNAFFLFKINFFDENKGFFIGPTISALDTVQKKIQVDFQKKIEYAYKIINDFPKGLKAQLTAGGKENFCNNAVNLLGDVWLSIVNFAIEQKIQNLSELESLITDIINQFNHVIDQFSSDILVKFLAIIQEQSGNVINYMKTCHIDKQYMLLFKTMRDIASGTLRNQNEIKNNHKNAKSKKQNQYKEENIKSAEQAEGSIQLNKEDYYLKLAANIFEECYSLSAKVNKSQKSDIEFAELLIQQNIEQILLNREIKYKLVQIALDDTTKEQKLYIKNKIKEGKSLKRQDKNKKYEKYIQTHEIFSNFAPYQDRTEDRNKILRIADSLHHEGVINVPNTRLIDDIVSTMSNFMHFFNALSDIKETNQKILKNASKDNFDLLLLLNDTYNKNLDKIQKEIVEQCFAANLSRINKIQNINQQIKTAQKQSKWPILNEVKNIVQKYGVDVKDVDVLQQDILPMDPLILAENILMKSLDLNQIFNKWKKDKYDYAIGLINKAIFQLINDPQVKYFDVKIELQRLISLKKDLYHNKQKKQLQECKDRILKLENDKNALCHQGISDMDDKDLITKITLRLEKFVNLLVKLEEMKNANTLFLQKNQDLHELTKLNHQNNQIIDEIPSLITQKCLIPVVEKVKELKASLNANGLELEQNSKHTIERAEVLIEKNFSLKI